MVDVGCGERRMQNGPVLGADICAALRRNEFLILVWQVDRETGF